VKTARRKRRNRVGRRCIVARDGGGRGVRREVVG
jgi:hypothetical protein